MNQEEEILSEEEAGEGEPEPNKLSEEEIEQRIRLGEILIRWRENAGLTQETLAPMIGIHHQSVGRYERGRGKSEPYPRKISFDLLLRWAAACKADPTEALHEEANRIMWREELMRRVSIAYASSADDRDCRAALALLKEDPQVKDMIYRGLGV